MSRIIVLIRSPPVTEVFSGIATPAVKLVTILPICILPARMLIVIEVPAIIPPEFVLVADPLNKLNSDFSVAATL